MSLEQAINDLKAAVEANTAALKAGGGKAAAAPAADKAAGATTKTDKKPAAPKVTRADVNAALEVLKEKKGVEAAKEVISSAGGVEKRADIPEDKFQAVIDAAKAATDAEEAADDL